MSGILSIFQEDTSEHWAELRRRAQSADSELLKQQIDRYQGMQEYVMIFRVPLHVAQIFLGRAVTPWEYSVARETLELRGIVYYGRGSFRKEESASVR